MTKVKVQKDVIDYIMNVGVKLAFKSNLRSDRNNLHHTGWDVKTNDGVWGVYTGGMLLN